jgi:hypothetical protein
VSGDVRGRPKGRRVGELRSTHELGVVDGREGKVDDVAQSAAVKRVLIVAETILEISVASAVHPLVHGQFVEHSLQLHVQK